MKLHVEIDMSGAAFDGRPAERYEEVKYILHAVALGLIMSKNGGEPDKIEMPTRDSNGNECGRAWVTDE